MPVSTIVKPPNNGHIEGLLSLVYIERLVKDKKLKVNNNTKVSRGNFGHGVFPVI